MKLKRHTDFINENYHPGKEVSIRKASEEEVKNFVESIEEYGHAEMNILDMISDFPEGIIGAFEDNIMIGAMRFNKSEKIKDYTEISTIFVNPTKRIGNIGKMLIQYAEDNSDGKLAVNPYTSEAEDFFSSIGFKYDEDIDPNDTNTMIK